MAVALGMTMISLPATAQQNSSLVHTVSVTVPPRVKVQVASLSVTPPPVSVGLAKEPTEGVALTVNATRTWILSIGSARTSTIDSSTVLWSLDSGSAFARLSSDVIVASGRLSNQPAAAGVYLRNAPKESASRIDGNMPSVVFTISAP
jgi:cell division septation protein DedD